MLWHLRPHWWERGLLPGSVMAKDSPRTGFSPAPQAWGWTCHHLCGAKLLLSFCWNHPRAMSQTASLPSLPQSPPKPFRAAKPKPAATLPALFWANYSEGRILLTLCPSSFCLLTRLRCYSGGQDMLVLVDCNTLFSISQLSISWSHHTWIIKFIF